MMEEVLTLIKREIAEIEKVLEKVQISQHPFINQVSEYVIFAGGKRIRPLLCVLCAKALSPAPIVNLYEVSLLFEYLHAATLLHDDVVDSAEFRRGRKAARNLWGNQATILVGDYLFAKALKIASRLKNPEIMEVITDTTLLLSEGEVLQLLHLDDTEISDTAYYEVIFRKTAVLMACSCKVGALLAGSEAFAKALFDYGYNIGMAFQIIDDLLDYISQETGKDRGKDFMEGKVTLPFILAYREAPPAEREELYRLLKSKNTDQKDFERAYYLIQKNNGFENSHKEAKKFVEKAKDCLSLLPSSPYKEALLFLCKYLLERKK